MNQDDDDLTAEERRVRAVVRVLPPVAADPEFRARLRRAFSASEIAPRRRSPLRVWALAASIVVALGGTALLSNDGGSWTAVATNGVGVVRIDGRAIDVADAAALASALEPGALITTDAKAEVQLAIRDTLALVVTPETTLRLPNVPGRWFARSVHAVLERGEVRGRTGRRFVGARLSIDLPGAIVEVTGTTFAVLRNAEGSCVCVLEGAVSMTDGGGRFVVGPKQRRVIPLGGETGRDEPIRPMEAMKLEMLRRQLLPTWTAESDSAFPP